MNPVAPLLRAQPERPANERNGQSVKERPILFSAPMVRALLDGRKTQTRRVVKPQPEAVLDGHLLPLKPSCPYGYLGDRLWVRETWAETDREDGTPVAVYAAGGCIAVGRGPQRRADDFLIPNIAWPDTPVPDRWRPSIHMPRWASRITLEVTGVGVERLQDISRDDVLREGIPELQDGDAVPISRHFDMRSIEHGRFRDLWESINGAGSWAANPWVWVVEFRRLEVAHG